MYVCVYVCMYVRMYVCMYVRTCVCTYMHVHVIFTSNLEMGFLVQKPWHKTMYTLCWATLDSQEVDRTVPQYSTLSLNPYKRSIAHHGQHRGPYFRSVYSRYNRAYEGPLKEIP